MGKPEIIDKLRLELSKDLTDECQVVYVLSRIRKYFELVNCQRTYKHLNFYCNWALHARIDRTQGISDLLSDLDNGIDSSGFSNFDPLIADLVKFLDSNELPKKWIDVSSDNNNYFKFLNLLVGIYSDTPLVFYSQTARVLMISKPTTPITGVLYDIEWHIHDEQK